MQNVNCRHCGIVFLSQRGRKYCSEECKKEATKIKWQEANIRKVRGTQGQFQDKVCPICEKIFHPQTHNQVYCCEECASIGRKQNQKEYFSQWYPENRRKVIGKVLERRKSQN